jgi:hypothetical protein
MPKQAQIYECKICNYVSSKKSNIDNHFATRKHKKEMMEQKKKIMEMENKPTILCSICNIKYLTKSGLWKHLQKHHNEQEPLSVPEPVQVPLPVPVPAPEPPRQEQSNTIVLDQATLVDLIKQNSEFKELLLEQHNKIIELANKATTNNNTINNNTVNSNNTFNLQVFLNETCKDAMNISEFIENLNIQFKELENVGNNGYVTGISDIILKRIKGLEVSKRPLHCTDVKRETMYIRDENEWNKDNEEKTKLKKFVEQVANQNYKKIPEWCQENPECRDMYHEKYEYCMQLMRNSLGDLDEKQEKLYDKVIKNIARQVTVDKNTITNE